MKETVFAALAACALASPAIAHDYSHDLMCSIDDVGGNKLMYTFANNTKNANGSFGGTYVETGFVKNGAPVISARGSRPIWFWDGTPNGANGVSNVISSQSAPGWRLLVGNFDFYKGAVGAKAVLAHNNRTIGAGACVRSTDGVPVPPNVVTDNVD
jgi:hypothetical protein